MYRKMVYLLIAVSLVFAVAVPSQMAIAAKPLPPGNEVEGRDGPPAIDYNNLPPAIQSANSLHASLSPEQATAMAQTLEKHMPAFKDIMLALAARERQAPDAEPQPIDKEITVRTIAELTAIETELSAVLSAEQMALYRAVVQPNLSFELSAGAKEPYGTDGYTDYCFYGAFYSSYVDYYGYYAYVYAYYNWYTLYYYGYTYYYAYDAYIYTYYGWYYGFWSLEYAATNYFELYYWGFYTVDGNGYPYPYNAYLYSDLSEYYSYYGYLYAYYAYYYDPYYTDYAYYAYGYAYYGWYGAYYAEYYNYLCYYYA
jgi:hypothetical protein